jgi:hypothetical protein
MNTGTLLRRNTNMPRRYVDDVEIENRIAPQIAAALRPILIPMEEQDMKINQENSELMDRLAREVWRSFRKS